MIIRVFWEHDNNSCKGTDPTPPTSPQHLGVHRPLCEFNFGGGSNPCSRWTKVVDSSGLGCAAHASHTGVQLRRGNHLRLGGRRHPEGGAGADLLPSRRQADGRLCPCWSRRGHHESGRCLEASSRQLQSVTPFQLSKTCLLTSTRGSRQLVCSPVRFFVALGVCVVLKNV